MNSKSCKNIMGSGGWVQGVWIQAEGTVGEGYTSLPLPSPGQSRGPSVFGSSQRVYRQSWQVAQELARERKGRKTLIANHLLKYGQQIQGFSKNGALHAPQAKWEEGHHADSSVCVRVWTIPGGLWRKKHNREAKRKSTIEMMHLHRLSFFSTQLGHSQKTEKTTRLVFPFHREEILPPLQSKNTKTTCTINKHTKWCS